MRILGVYVSYETLMLALIVVFILSLIAQGKVRRVFNRYNTVPAARNIPAHEAAREMLLDNGSGVTVQPVQGTLTDHYDPRDNTLHLSKDNCFGGSVASVAVACHEAGHAIQHAVGYSPVAIRTALVPVVNIAQSAWSLLFFGGIILGMTGLIRIAVIAFGASVLFQLVTLPVEFDASRRAVAYLAESGQEIDKQGANEVLTAAALTYVAAALTSVIQLLYLMSRTRRR